MLAQKAKMATFDEMANHLPIQCMDDVDGVPGVIVYDDLTFPIFPEQWTASDSGQGPYSSVRLFQSANYENDDTAVGPPETESNSQASLQEEVEIEEMTGGIMEAT